MHSFESKAGFDTKFKVKKSSNSGHCNADSSSNPSNRDLEFPDELCQKNREIHCNRGKHNSMDSGHGSCSASKMCEHFHHHHTEQCCNLGYFGLGPKATREDARQAWTTIWNSLTKHCRAELCTIDVKKFNASVNNYLERHSFCTDCTRQIKKANKYLCSIERSEALIKPVNKKGAEGDKLPVDIKVEHKNSVIVRKNNKIIRKVRRDSGTIEITELIQPRLDLASGSSNDEEEDGDDETDFLPTDVSGSEDEGSENDCQSDGCHSDCCSLDEEINTPSTQHFSGIRFCNHNSHINNNHGHLHVTTFYDNVAYLLRKAEKELICHLASNGHEQRHAVSMLQAQNEILICVGIYLYERLHKIWQKVQELNLASSLLASAFCENMKNKFYEILSENIGEDVYLEEALKAIEDLDGDEGKNSSSKSKKKRDKKNAKKLAKKKEITDKQQNKVIATPEKTLTKSKSKSQTKKTGNKLVTQTTEKTNTKTPEKFAVEVETDSGFSKRSNSSSVTESGHEAEEQAELKMKIKENKVKKDSRILQLESSDSDSDFDMEEIQKEMELRRLELEAIKIKQMQDKIRQQYIDATYAADLMVN